MTLYRFITIMCKCIYRLFNGKPQVEGLENLPSDRPVILASTHRSFFDIILLISETPSDYLEIAFMAKKELFNHPFWNWVFSNSNVFPVDRERPSRTTIKEAVKKLNEQKKYLGIFPSGSRYETDIKGGASLIQALAGVDIIPVAIQPPLSTKQFFGRKKAKLAFGKPIKYEQGVKYTKDKLAEVDAKLRDRLDRLDQMLTPGYRYIPPVKTS